MDFLYISPEFPSNYANFVIQLDKAGVDVWGVGEADTACPNRCGRQ